MIIIHLLFNQTMPPLNLVHVVTSTFSQWEKMTRNLEEVNISGKGLLKTFCVEEKVDCRYRRAFRSDINELIDEGSYVQSTVNDFNQELRETPKVKLFKKQRLQT